MWCSSCVNCFNLISTWILILIWLVFFMFSGGFPRRFPRGSFHFWSLSSWLAAFRLGAFPYFIYCQPCTLWLYIFLLNFYFYWSGLESILVVWSFLSFLVHRHLLGFLYQIRMFFMFYFFPNCFWLPRNSFIWLLGWLACIRLQLLYRE